MAGEISRNLNTINDEIKKLNTEIKEANAELKNTEKALKLNPSNIESIEQKYSALNKQLSANEKTITSLQRKKALLEQENQAGTISLSKYNSELRKTDTALAAAEKNAKDLTDKLAKQNAEISKAKWDNWNSKLDKAQKTATKFSKAALGIVAALTAVTIATVSLADELSDTSAKLNTTVEDLQIGRNLYEKAAGGADEYDGALRSLASTMSSIAKGRGAAYLTALGKIGLKSEDLVGKNTGEQLAIVTAALATISDEAYRTETAMTIMGESGRSVALIAGQSAESLNAYTETLRQSGLISSEQAAAADQMANTFNDVKLQVQAASAELVVALLPAINTLIEILQNYIIPILSAVAGWFNSLGKGGQTFLLILVGIIVVLPKLIAIVKGISSVLNVLKLATYGQAAATGTLATASIPLQPIFLAIAAALLIVITLIGIFSQSAKDAAKSATSMMDSMDNLSEYENITANVNGTTESVSNTSTSKNLNVNLKVEATGDTPISEANAQLIAIDLAKIVNEQLGELI